MKPAMPKDAPIAVARSTATDWWVATRSRARQAATSPIAATPKLRRRDERFGWRWLKSNPTSVAFCCIGQNFHAATSAATTTTTTRASISRGGMAEAYPRDRKSHPRIGLLKPLSLTLSPMGRGSSVAQNLGQQQRARDRQQHGACQALGTFPCRLTDPPTEREDDLRHDEGLEGDQQDHGHDRNVQQAKAEPDRRHAAAARQVGAELLVVVAWAEEHVRANACQTGDRDVLRPGSDYPAE